MKKYKVKNLLVADIPVKVLDKPLIVLKQPLGKRLIATLFDFDYNTYKEVTTHSDIWAEHRDVHELVYYLPKYQLKSKMTLQELLDWQDTYDFENEKGNSKQKIGFK